MRSLALDYEDSTHTLYSVTVVGISLHLLSTYHTTAPVYPILGSSWLPLTPYYKEKRPPKDNTYSQTREISEMDAVLKFVV